MYRRTRLFGDADRRPIGLVLILGGLALFSALPSGCGGTDEPPPLTVVGDRPIDRPLAGEPEAPEEFRHLWPTPNPEASRLFNNLAEHPGDGETRERLAALYRAEGFLAAAHFIEATRAPLRGETIVYEVPLSPIAWGLGDEDAMSRLAEDRQRASEICDLTLENRYQEAVDRAHELLQEGPYSAVEVGSWSYTALWYIVVDAGPMEDVAPEMAFRVFLTGLEEGLAPHCVATRAAGHWLLSRFFQQLGDPVSAYTAAAIEHELVPSSETYEQNELRRFEQLKVEVEEYVQKDH